MLSVQNLEYYYGRIHALRGVSFEIKEGDLCVIIGSNGAGKSTLMSSLIGMLDATGDIYLNGEKLGREKPYARINRGMVLVPEGRRIFPNLTVTENLMMGGYTAKNREEGIQRAFKMFPVLEERKKQRAGTLSGGEQQMLAIGRGLMANPRLLLLDEPFSALDYQTRLTVGNDIGQILKHEHKTAILVTHDLSEAVSLADRVLILTPRPATISKIVDISFELENDTPMHRRNASEFKNYFNLIWEELNGYE